MMTVIIIAIVGLAISAYGITVERKLQRDAQYKPACDISDKISCSRAFLSPYGKMLGISNIWASVLYYCAVMILAMMKMTILTLVLTSIGVAVSAVFAYVLYFKVRSACPICTALYLVNIALAIACSFS